MPKSQFFIDLERSPPSARTFLWSQEGLILHEIGHLCAANTRIPCAGHLIIDEKRGKAAWVLVPIDIEKITADEAARKFVAAAAAVTEMVFCGTTDAVRLTNDVNSFFGQPIHTPIDDTLLIDTVTRWRAAYWSAIIAIEDRIEAAWRRALALVRRRLWIMSGYQVIPSVLLIDPSDAASVAHHSSLTSSYHSRRQALQRYLSVLDVPMPGRVSQIGNWTRHHMARATFTWPKHRKDRKL